MSKVITFSRTFPSYHPRKGESTFFLEKIHWGLIDLVHTKWLGCFEMLLDLNKHLPKKLIQDFIDSIDDDINFSDSTKGHTIRAGHRFKVGDWFSPCVWSGKPYNSKQIIIAPDIQVKKTWDFECHTEADDRESDWSFIIFNGNNYTCYQNEYLDPVLEAVSLNDGFSDPQDFLNWVQPKNRNSKPLIGQIICWNENIEY